MTYRIPRRILVAPSGFKESLDATVVARAIAAGVRRAVPGIRVDTAPIADGGEGTAAILAEATGGQLHALSVTGPVGEPVTAAWAALGGSSRGTAVVEMAAAAGLSLVPRDARDPLLTTTYGVGELIAAAARGGARRIIIGCGDSGTCDGGAGALQALGVRLYDERGRQLTARGGGSLAEVARIDTSGLLPELRDIELTAACNIHNVLTGPQGVARVFGPQKGATAEQVERLELGLRRWAAALQRLDGSPVDLATCPGGGASGGLGAGIAGALGAELRSRFEVLLDSGLTGIDLDKRIAKADLVITAEGAIDTQTARGKVPAEVARRAQRKGVPVLALAGSLRSGAISVHDIGIAAMASILPVPMPLSEAVVQGETLLADAAERTMRILLLGAAISGGRGKGAA